MSADYGWIRLNRSIQDHWLWKDEPFDKARAWIDLLMLANWEDKKTSYKGEIILCKRGDVNLSISYLAKRWSWSRWKVNEFLSLLEKDNMVKVNATTHRTTITLINYGVYQISPTTNLAADLATNRQQTDITNKDNKYNNLSYSLSSNNMDGFVAMKSDGYTKDDFDALE